MLAQLCSFFCDVWVTSPADLMFFSCGCLFLLRLAFLDASVPGSHQIPTHLPALQWSGDRRIQTIFLIFKCHVKVLCVGQLHLFLNPSIFIPPLLECHSFLSPHLYSRYCSLLLLSADLRSHPRLTDSHDEELLKCSDAPYPQH